MPKVLVLSVLGQGRELVLVVSDFNVLAVVRIIKFETRAKVKCRTMVSHQVA